MFEFELCENEKEGVASSLSKLLVPSTEPFLGRRRMVDFDLASSFPRPRDLSVMMGACQCFDALFDPRRFLPGFEDCGEGEQALGPSWSDALGDLTVLPGQ